MQTLAKKVSKKFGEIIPLYLKTGVFFSDIDTNIAKGYYNKALSALDKVDVMPKDIKLGISEEIKDHIRECEKIK